MILLGEDEKRDKEIPLAPEYEHLLEGKPSPFLSVEYVTLVDNAIVIKAFCPRNHRMA
jgi:hypothetical protein